MTSYRALSAWKPRNFSYQKRHPSNLYTPSTIVVNTIRRKRKILFSNADQRQTTSHTWHHWSPGPNLWRSSFRISPLRHYEWFHYDYELLKRDEPRPFASQEGLRAVLFQRHGYNESVIAYATRTFSDLDRKYSTTEKECIAILWGIRKMRQYLEGYRFTVITDHHLLKCPHSLRITPIWF